MTRCYIFDVDGTLTEPRQHIDADFAREFIKWAYERHREDDHIYIATGSD